MPTPEPATSRTEVSRDLAADPVSAALLLTTRAALEWWPGLRIVRGGSVGGDGDGDGADVGVGGGGAVPATLSAGRSVETVGIEALPPRRTATAFVAAFRVTGGSYGTTDGAVTLVRRPDGTRATLRLAGPRDDLEPAARRFLSRLAKAAEAA